MEIEENTKYFLNPKNKKFFEVEGLCNICRKPGKIYTCSLCGNNVCIDCYDATKRLCKPCAKYPGKIMK